MLLREHSHSFEDCHHTAQHDRRKKFHIFGGSGNEKVIDFKTSKEQTFAMSLLCAELVEKTMKSC